jgi:isoquinoline 1-oxidoreductase beta subunit
VRRIVQISSGVAVVANSYWTAKTGREALKITWDEGPNAQLSSAEISRIYAEAAKQAGPVARKEGDAVKALGGAAKTMDAVYEVPFLAHATMEPMNCTAHVRKDNCEVWVGTQNQTGTQRTAMRITGFPREKVKVNTLLLGGGFGRRGEQDFVADAVETSKAVNAPVKVVWSREDDTQHDHYRPATYNLLSAALAESGAPAAWLHRIVAPSIGAQHGRPLKGGIDSLMTEGAANIPYAIPNLQVEYIYKDLGIPVGFWRSVGASQNAFITESFIDELAAAAGKDPFEFRRSLLTKAARHKGVLELAAEKGDWGKPLPQGRFRGIAVAFSYGSYASEVAEVSIEKDGKVRVHRVVCAIDCGTVVNPDTVKAQVEGSIVWGLTAALYGAITLDKGRVQQSNFHDYRMLRINEMPAVEVHIIPSTAPAGGVGEPGVPPLAPAVCNAVFAGTGKRIRKLPIRAEELTSA